MTAQELLRANAQRIAHFRDRLLARQLDAAEVVIVVIDVDDRQGAVLAEHLMPGHDWDAYRARGEVPVARGLAGRAGVEDFVAHIAPPAAAELRAVRGPAVVVIAGGQVCVGQVLSDEQGG